MSGHTDYTAMDGLMMLSACRDDAAKWAAAFCQHAKKFGHSDIDEGWMIGWFANAIEQSHAVRVTYPESNSHADLVKALEFYSDCNRYDGPNQRLIGDDPYTPKDRGYLQDVTRDGGDIARAALATLTARKA